MRSNSIFLGMLVSIVAACGGGGGDSSGVTTPPPPVQKLGSITVSPGTLNLTAGATGTLTVQALDESGGVISSASGYTYSSGTPTVAEVSGSGSVLAISAGTSTVTVSLTRDGVTKTATAAVNVTGQLPSSENITAGANIAFTPSQVLISKGGKVAFSFGAVTHNVTFDPAAGAPTNIGNSATTIVERTFNTAGNFSFICTLHAGMSGTVLVR
jgi:plastocyanin